MTRWCRQQDLACKILLKAAKASGTSKKTELKLTKVARASLEELKLDFEDFLRQRKLNIWVYGDPRSKDLVRKRLKTADEYAFWVRSVSISCEGSVEEVGANGVLILLSVACTLLSRQIAAQAEAFERDGGFTEKLHRVRTEARKQKSWS